MLFRVNPAFGVVAWQSRGRHRKLGEVCELRHSAYDVTFDEFSGLLGGLRRAVGIVISHEVDLSTIDAATVINEIR